MGARGTGPHGPYNLWRHAGLWKDFGFKGVDLGQWGGWSGASEREMQEGVRPEEAQEP